MPAARFPIIVHSFEISPPKGNPPYDRVLMKTDLIFKYIPGFTADFWCTLFVRDSSRNPWENWVSIADIKFPPVIYKKGKNDRPGTVGRQMGFESKRYEGGIKVDLFNIIEGKRANITIENLPVRRVLWPGKHEFSLGFFNGLMQPPPPNEKRKPPVIHSKYETPFGISPEARLEKVRDSQKISLNSKFSEPNFSEDEHIYSIAETNIGQINYTGRRKLDINGKTYWFNAGWELSDFGYSLSGRPIISVAETAARRGVKISDPKKPWPAISEVYEELKKATLKNPVDSLPWSPVAPKNKNVDLLMLERALLPFANRSNELASTSFVAGETALEGDQSEEHAFAKIGALYTAFEALRVSPNNIHALACLAGFAWYAERYDISLDFFITLNLKLMLMDRILREQKNTPIWFSVHQILAWHSHRSVARFSLEPAYLFQLISPEPVIPLVFHEVERVFAENKNMKPAGIRATSSVSTKQLFGNLEELTKESELRKVFTIPDTLPRIVENKK